MSHRILVVGQGGVVEDQAGAESVPLVEHLGYAGFDVLATLESRLALTEAGSTDPDLVVVDLPSPITERTELCRQIRREVGNPHLPVVIVTQTDEHVDAATALEQGFDDIVTRPYDPRELVARIRALLRRTSGESTVLTAGPIELDPSKYTASVHGRRMELTSKEFELLRLLMKARGGVVSREAAMEKVWGYDRRAAIDTRTLDVHIRRLRMKLGTEGARIRTVRTVGYRMDLSAEWIRYGS